MNSNIFSLFFTKKNNYIIFFGYSPFQINLIYKLINFNGEFFNSKILLFDLNKSLNGRNQFKKSCDKFKNFIEYNQLSIFNLIQILILIKVRKIKIIHGNYNTISFKLLSKIHNKYLFGLDDGSNSLLMPFRLKNKFNRFYTIFSALKECTNLRKYVDIVEIQRGIDNKIKANKIIYNDVYICGSADVEEGLIEESTYIKMILSILKYLQNFSFKNIFYYPHRRESNHKINKLKNFLNTYPNLSFINPLVSFDDYYEINNLNSCVISLTSTLEKSLEFRLNHQNFLIKPVRYSTNDIDQNYSLDYAVISSSLSSQYSRDEILIFLNNQLINTVDFLKNKVLVSSSMKEINDKQIINMVRFYLKNKKIQKWKGQPILISENSRILRWEKISENYKLINYLKIAPELIIGYL